jgi:hypothetical protein
MDFPGLNRMVDHSTCPPDAYDRDPGTSIEVGQPVDEHGLMLCRHCLAPVMFCATIHDYTHIDPSTAACFLIPGRNRRPT